MTRESEEGQSKRGRPKKDSGHGLRLDVRIGQKEKEMLEHLEIESDKNKSEIIRKAIQMYYNFESKRW